jgi:hypothetical protein
VSKGYRGLCEISETVLNLKKSLKSEFWVFKLPIINPTDKITHSHKNSTLNNALNFINQDMEPA